MKRSCLVMTFTTGILLLSGCSQTSYNLSSHPHETASAQTLSPQENLKRAKQLAWDAALLVQKPPHPAERWQAARVKWRQAVRLLEAIPPKSALYSEAQQKLAEYRPKYESITQRLTDETTAADNFAQAQKVAWQAAVTVQEPPHTLQIWQRSLERWGRATRLLGDIPPMTTVSNDAQVKLITYRQNYRAIAQRIAAEKSVLAILQQFSERVAQLDTWQTKALTGRTEDPIGITYETYERWLRSLQELEQQLKAVPIALQNPAVAEMQTAIEDYRFALSLWQTYLRHKRANADWLQNSDFFNRLVPLSLIDSKHLLSRYDVKVHQGAKTDKVPLKSAVWAIWEKAEEHARAAQQKALLRSQSQ